MIVPPSVKRDWVLFRASRMDTLPLGREVWEESDRGMPDPVLESSKVRTPVAASAAWIVRLPLIVVLPFIEVGWPMATGLLALGSMVRMASSALPVTRSLEASPLSLTRKLASMTWSVKTKARSELVVLMVLPWV